MKTLTTMKKSVLPVAVALASLTGGQVMAEDFKTALTGGDVNFDFRYRYEHVDQDNALDDAHASTLRSRLTYTTQQWRDWQAQVEVDDVSQIGEQNHNDRTDTGFSDHSLVLDPEDTQFNQVWVAYKGIADTTVKAGRQRINFDNQRFFGGVAWRQAEQTYDALSVTNKSLPDTTVTYGYLNNINNITGTNVDTDTNLLNINYGGWSFGSLTLYGYMIDSNPRRNFTGNDTYGLRFVGAQTFDGWKLHYEAEWATQEEDTGTAYDADYTHLVLGATVAGVTVKVAQELQESDGGTASFRTPLGTNHKFNGWADQFLATPAEGLEDTYVSVSGKVLGAKVIVAYHEFEPDTGPGDLGDEINIAVAKKLFDNTTLLLKYADYSAGDGRVASDSRVDTEKLWLQAQVKF